MRMGLEVVPVVSQNGDNSNKQGHNSALVWFGVKFQEMNSWQINKPEHV